MTAPQIVVPSLLYPAEPPAQTGGRHASGEVDLGLASIVRALDYDGRHARFVAGVLAELCADPAAIVYRQDILDDLLRLPEVAAGLAAMLPLLGELATAGRTSRWGDEIPLLQVGERLAELENYLACVAGLAAALDSAGAALRAEGLLRLRAFLADTRAHPDYRRLAGELPQLRAQLDQAGSVTIGINLDAQLRPESATIVALSPGRFAGKGSLLDRLFGERGAADAVRGVTALYKAEQGGRQHTPEHELFRDMDRLLERVAAPVAAALSGYTRVSAAGLAALDAELALYLGAARLAGELRAAGMALCRPEVAPAEERRCEIAGVYSLDLALRLRAAHGPAGMAAIVPNDVALGPDAWIAIVTGPNSGGKTTYTRAVGQAQALFQAGLLVPGRRARISPVDGIFTHFAAAERLEIGGGRLDEELERLERLFRQATGASLALLNEPLASTDHAAARALCRDILAGLGLLGARAIFVTHVHELVDDLLDGESPAPGVVSLVAGYTPPAGNGAEPAPSYQIAPGRPQVAGYAAELARRHGLSLGQIAATLRQRGVDIPPAEDGEGRAAGD
ncbi:MAG: hypothetical protein IPO81_20100 [Kouleothrix sp.]|nr:hypothetical protein [Kouleothrix sp.]